MGRRFVLVLILLLAGCGNTEVPDTDCPTPEPAAERVRFASLVLVGTAQSWDGTTAEFEIEEIWRGPDLPDEVEIVPEPGRAYTPGVRYLLFPSNSPSPLADARCSATVRWSEELADLRPLVTRTPGTAPAEDADLPWEWVIGFAAVAGLATATRKLLDRRRHPEPEWNPEFTFDQDG